MDSDFAVVEDQSGTRSALDGGGFRGYIGDEGPRGSCSHVIYNNIVSISNHHNLQIYRNMSGFDCSAL